MHCEDDDQWDDDHALDTHIHVYCFLQFFERRVVLQQGEDLEQSKDTHQTIEPRESSQPDQPIDILAVILFSSSDIELQL